MKNAFHILHFTFYIFLSACSRSQTTAPAPPPFTATPPSAAAPREDGPDSSPAPQVSALVFRPPTGQDVLDGSLTTNVFMHTGTGNPESGMYGDIRTGNDGRARYHGGIDIAPLQRDRRGNALDTVHAIADGRVAYVNRSSGSSNYGIYIVLTHREPAFGEMYSLYAHLASVAPGLAAGQDVSAGHTLGVMGHTPDIPKARCHLHLETGLVFTTRFASHATARKLTNSHGNWNGRALQGFNPCDLYAKLDAGGRFDLAAHVQSLPPAFRALARVEKPVGFFERYPSLWQGAPLATNKFPAWVLIDFSAEGLPVFGRLATPSEQPAAGSHQLFSVDENVLGRNGRRLVGKGKNGWALTQNGLDWIALLLL